jgi:hypothetical protein
MDGVEVMAAWRQAIELSLDDEDTAKLNSIAPSRTEPASRGERARILLAYRRVLRFFAVGRTLGLHHQTVRRCVERAMVEGPMAALEDHRRPGREPEFDEFAAAMTVPDQGMNLAAEKLDAASKLTAPWRSYSNSRA